MSLTPPPVNGTSVTQKVTPVIGVVIDSKWDSEAGGFQIHVQWEQDGVVSSRWFNNSDFEVTAS